MEIVVTNLPDQEIAISRTTEEGVVPFFAPDKVEVPAAAVQKVVSVVADKGVPSRALGPDFIVAESTP